MMNQFRVVYFPGSMGLDHSAWWLCERKVVEGIVIDWKIRQLKWSDYK